MRVATVYQCDFCSFQTTDETECLSHEARKHYGITIQEYKQWKELHDKVVRAGCRVSNCKIPQTEAEFDQAIHELLDFEKDHKLPDTMPRHFR